MPILEGIIKTCLNTLRNGVVPERNWWRDPVDRPIVIKFRGSEKAWYLLNN